MCTLIAFHQSVPGASLVVAANRDEYFERPAEGLALREAMGGRIVSPLDVLAGGTWLGLNAYGLFAAVTNRRAARPDPSRLSRGQLVTAALEARSAREAVSRVEERVSQGAYNPFNLLVADAGAAIALSLGPEGGRLEQRPLPPGAHVIGNVALSGEASPKLEALRDRTRRLAGQPAEQVLESLGRICRQHEAADPLAAVCVHTPSYGTRSSLLLRLEDPPAGGRPRQGELHFSEGAPCRAPYTEFTPLLRALFQEAQRGAGEVTRNPR